MPVFTCGGMRFQYQWQEGDPIPAESQKNLENAVRHAFEVGINHFETARGYGTSEQQLGEILPKLPRDEIIVQTKIGISEKNGDFEKDFEKSMRLLKLDRVDLLSLHGVNNADLLRTALRPGNALDAARKLQAAGRVRHIGFSTHAPTHTILDAIKTDAFEYVNLHWYFVNDFNWPAVLEATCRDMGVFIISPNDKGGKLYEPPEKLVRLCAPYSPMVFNDLYCLARPEVHTLSIGAARPEDFDEHLKALNYYKQAPELAAAVEDRLREAMDEALGEEWARGWWKGLPEYEETPNHINLLEILRLWSLAKSLDLVEFAKMRYNLLGNASHWFPGTNAAEFDAAKIRDVVKESAFSERIPAILEEAHKLLEGEEMKRLSES